MGLMFRRRRPVMRLAAGAATAGVAYHAGKRRAEQDATADQAQAAYDATQGSPSYAPPPAGNSGGSDGVGDLDHLIELHNQGALSDDEFAAAKARLLGL